jgi:hypothetical protein
MNYSFEHARYDAREEVGHAGKGAPRKDSVSDALSRRLSEKTGFCPLSARFRCSGRVRPVFIRRSTN